MRSEVEGILEGRMGLTVNREKTKTLDFREPHTTLTFLGYDFRMVRDRLFGTGKRYLTFGPSKKSMKRVREKIHEITHARNGLLTVEKVVGRLNKLTKGWGAFYSVGYPSKAFHAVNGYALRRLARFGGIAFAGVSGHVRGKSRIWAHPDSPFEDIRFENCTVNGGVEVVNADVTFAGGTLAELPLTASEKARLSKDVEERRNLLY